MWTYSGKNIAYTVDVNKYRAILENRKIIIPVRNDTKQIEGNMDLGKDQLGTKKVEPQQKP